MSITDVSDISANLLAAQDNQSRKPLVSLISAPKLNDIPFDGQFLTHETYDIYEPECLTHSTGRLVIVAHDYYDNDGYIKIIITDVDRQEFVITHYRLSARQIYCLSICELTNGDIGLVYMINYLNDDYYASNTFDLDRVFSGGINIVDRHQNYLSTDAWVQKVVDDNYITAYSYMSTITGTEPGTGLTFVSGGAGVEDYILGASSVFASDGFVAGQTITTAGAPTSANNGTFTIYSVIANRITLTLTNTLVDEVGDGDTTIKRNDWFVRTHYTADFITWSVETLLSIGNLTSTWMIDNISMITLTTGEVWMWFDVIESTGTNGELLKNIYYSIGTDVGTGGEAWGNAVKVTNYSNYEDTAEHPVAVQRVADTMDVVFTRNRAMLHLGTGDGFWAGSDYTFTHHIDHATRMLYVLNGRFAFQNVVKINIDTWQVVDYWDDATTVPQFTTDLSGHGGGEFRQLSEGPYIITYLDNFAYNTPGMHVWFLDDSTPGASVITTWGFDVYAPMGLSANFDEGAAAGYEGDYRIQYAQFVESTKRIYLLMRANISGGEIIGYIDTAGVGSYHVVVAGDLIGIYENIGMRTTGGMYVDTADSYIVLASGYNGAGGNRGVCVVYSTSGGEIRRWLGGDDDQLPGFDPNFPKRGMDDPFIYDGVVYGGLHGYTTDVGYEHQRGLVACDISSGIVETHRPSFSSADGFNFGKPSFMEIDPDSGNAKIIMTVKNYGVAVFDVVSKSWELFNDDIPGFPALDLLHLHHVTYDPVLGLIVMSADGSGVFMFSKEGYLNTPWFIEGINSSGWTFDDTNPEQLVYQPDGNTNAVVCKEPDTTSIYAFWQNTDSAGLDQIMWDKDGSELDISQYIVNTTDVKTNHSIDGSPATLDFTLSYGHLFDPNNISSLLSTTLQKGRKIELRWGETISGSPDWSNGGDFYVVSTTLGFVKGKYPTLTAHCEDQRTIWQHSHVFATDNYVSLPDVVLKDLLENLAGIDNTLTDFPTFVNETEIYHQWIESDLETIINQICSRFGYFFRFDIDGKATARQISNALSIDHTYADNTKLITYTPDDRYSDFTNRITVMGVERNPTEVLFQEERIGLYSGTLGWWGCEKEIIVWFSDDRSRRCLYPRLQKLDSAEVNMFFKLRGGVTEKLITTGATTDPDDRYKYCTLEVTAPSLVSALAAAIAAYAVASAIPDWVITDPISGEGFTIPVGRIVEKVAIVIALLILGSEANWQSEVHARPLGNINRKVLATWDDEAHQIKIANTITRTFEDPLCYSGADCQVVADFEGMVVQMQRKRIIITKIAHLQDEEGDTIRVFHPYGLQAIDMFITDINRKYKKGTESTPGYFEDEITGWVVA